MRRIALLSDTHGHLDEAILRHISGCHEVWHAGDIGGGDVSARLQELPNFKAVYGNIDGATLRAEFPEQQYFEVEGLQVLLRHIVGSPGRYTTEVQQFMASAPVDLLVCGHSHICLVKRIPRWNLLHLNPGAAGFHGFHKVRTLLRMELSAGAVRHLEVVELGSRSGRRT